MDALEFTPEAARTICREFNRRWPVGSGAWAIQEDGSGLQGVTCSESRPLADCPVIQFANPGGEERWYRLAELVMIARPAPAGAKEDAR